MTVATEVLRRLDPRKSYDRGPWTGQPEAHVEASANGAPAGLASLSTADLQRELARRDRGLEELQSRRARIVAEIAAVDSAIAELTGGESAPASPEPARHVISRPRNSLTLADAIAAAVEPGEQVTPAEVADRVKKDGFLTSSKSFAQAVAVALAKHAGFRRVGRGQYRRVE